MSGGINAWNGLRATGAPEAGMAWFAGAMGPEELIALAWFLEEGSRMFYAGIAENEKDRDAHRLLTHLSEAEEHHKASLTQLYGKLTGKEAGPDFPRPVLRSGAGEDRMEGGVSVAEALVWAKDKNPAEILELMMSLEANAYDLYIKMSRHVDDAESIEVFRTLSGEEKVHLEMLAEEYEKRLNRQAS